MSDAAIEFTVDDSGTAIVRLNRPELRNAITLAMWQQLASLFTELSTDNAVRAVILTGVGGHFSVGADVMEFASVREGKDQSRAYEDSVNACAHAIASTPKPVIAAIEGYCLGGGCHLALACDFRFAQPGAEIGIPAAKLSIVYGVRSTQRLLALVGIAEAKRILFTAERLPAAEALRVGLIERISDDCLSAARAFAADMAALAPLSIAGAKLILNGSAVGPELDPAAAHVAIDRASESADYREGRQAFAEKRRPRFYGR